MAKEFEIENFRNIENQKKPESKIFNYGENNKVYVSGEFANELACIIKIDNIYYYGIKIFVMSTNKTNLSYINIFNYKYKYLIPLINNTQFFIQKNNISDAEKYMDTTGQNLDLNTNLLKLVKDETNHTLGGGESEEKEKQKDPKDPRKQENPKKEFEYT